MVEIYKAGNEEFGKNGDMTLFPEECTVEVEMNGIWEMELIHPIDEQGRWKYIEEGAVIAAPLLRSKKQLFRVYKRTKTYTEVTAYARPIFFDAANEVLLRNVKIVDARGKIALNNMLSGQGKYKAESDITLHKSAEYDKMNLIEACQGDDENSFLNVWGGEVEYDNYTIKINEKVGADHGARAEMGYNSNDIQEEVDMSNVATRLIPVAYNGYMLEGDAPWIDSSLINNYPVIYTKVIEFTDVKLQSDAGEDEKGFANLEELRKELVRLCKEQYEQGIDKPQCNYKCDLVGLEKTGEYKDIKELEEISLGDTVLCRNRRIGIETEARAIKITYDCIRKRNTEVELGNFKYNYINDMASVIKRVDSAIREDGSVVADRIKGTIDTINASLHAQSSAAKKVDSAAFLIEVLDKAAELYGAMEAGTQGLRLAKEKKEDGTWDWRTCITAAGIIADTIVSGIISDKYGNNYFDLDAGNLVAKKGYIGPFRLFEGGMIIDEGVGGQYPQWVKQEDGTYNLTSQKAWFDQVTLKTASLGNATIGQANGKATKSGTAEFSDGTYLQFEQGILVGGRTAQGDI